MWLSLGEICSRPHFCKTAVGIGLMTNSCLLDRLNSLYIHVYIYKYLYIYVYMRLGLCQDSLLSRARVRERLITKLPVSPVCVLLACSTGTVHLPPQQKILALRLGFSLLCSFFGWNSSWPQLHTQARRLPQASLGSLLDSFITAGSGRGEPENS